MVSQVGENLIIHFVSLTGHFNYDKFLIPDSYFCIFDNFEIRPILRVKDLDWAFQHFYFLLGFWGFGVLGFWGFGGALL